MARMGAGSTGKDGDLVSMRAETTPGVRYALRWPAWRLTLYRGAWRVARAWYGARRGPWRGPWRGPGELVVKTGDVGDSMFVMLKGEA
jgi:hypothetical protein